MAYFGYVGGGWGLFWVCGVGWGCMGNSSGWMRVGGTLFWVGGSGWRGEGVGALFDNTKCTSHNSNKTTNKRSWFIFQHEKSFIER